jgi:hypothetical protein
MRRAIRRARHVAVTSGWNWQLVRDDRDRRLRAIETSRGGDQILVCVNQELARQLVVVTRHRAECVEASGDPSTTLADYSRCRLMSILVRRQGRRRGIDRIISLRMACRTAGKVG